MKKSKLLNLFQSSLFTLTNTPMLKLNKMPIVIDKNICYNINIYGL